MFRRALRICRVDCDLISPAAARIVAAKPQSEVIGAIVLGCSPHLPRGLSVGLISPAGAPRPRRAAPPPAPPALPAANPPHGTVIAGDEIIMLRSS